MTGEEREEYQYYLGAFIKDLRNPNVKQDDINSPLCQGQ